MIKRPFVIMLLAFVVGSIITRYKVPVALVIISLLLLVVILILYVFKVSNRYINTLDHFLILLPILVYLGFALTNWQQRMNPMNTAFDQKVMGNLTGTIYMIVDKGNNTQVYLKNNQIKLSNKSNSYQSKKIILFTKNAKQLKIGNRIVVFGEINKFKNPTNLGQFDEAQYYKNCGIDYKVYEKKSKVIDSHYNHFKQGLYEIKLKLVHVYSSILNKKNAGIVSAMLLGEKSMLAEEIKELYQQNGITHILAISGLHVSLIGLTIYKILITIGLNQLSSSMISTIMIYCYGLLTDFSVSTNRAVVMLIVSLFANVLGRTYDLLSATALSALIILIQNPLQIYDAGFLLSFGAILAIGLIVPEFIKISDQIYAYKLQKYKKEKKERMKKILFIRKGIMNSLLVCFSVNLITIPILLYFFYEIPTFSLIVNLLIIPPMTLLVWLTIVGGISGCFNEFLGRFLIGGAHYILEWYEALCSFFESLPYHMVVVGKPSMIRIIIYYAILLIALLLIKRFEKKRYLTILILLLFLFVKKDTKELTMTFLDVSQGDGIFFETPSNTTYFIDGGSTDVSKIGKYRIEPFLKASGISTIDYAIVTHTDADHVSGLKEILASDRIRIKHLILPDTSMKDDSYMQLIDLAKLHDTQVIYLTRGDVIKDGEVKLTCLHPSKEYEPVSRNAYSTVISLEYHDFQGLLVGDLEEDGEQLLLDEKDQDGSNRLLDYDLLKVAHHGSKYSTSISFLERVKPEISIISAGINNRYGHPHKELLERLEKCGSEIYKTTECGAINVETDGESVEITRFVKEKDESER